MWTLLVVKDCLLYREFKYHPTLHIRLRACEGDGRLKLAEAVVEHLLRDRSSEVLD